MTSEVEQCFRAEELAADASLAPVELVFSGSVDTGWTVSRNGARHLVLGRGYRLLRIDRCGVCSTDLDRPFLPFPLPQVVGHELVARDSEGRRYVVEINASHVARDTSDACAFCRAGLETHCPERLVLGIHDLPGGFGPFVLAPRHAVIPVPAGVPDDVAVLVEPFAAALHAVDRIAPRDDDRVAVLGTRRLGLLVVAALAARRRERRARYTIEAWSRHASLRARALSLGADRATAPPHAAAGPGADVVVDTTGSPQGLSLATALAAREVHLKSTHGQASGDLRHTTELVVDEITLAPLPARGVDAAAEVQRHATAPDGRPRVAWLCACEPPPELEASSNLLRGTDARTLLDIAEAQREGLPRADVAVVDRADSVDPVIRPDPHREHSLVRPRGAILVHPRAADDAPPGSIVTAVASRGLRLSTSRCGDFRAALGLLERDAALCDALAGLVTHHLPAARLAEALRLARSPDSIKVVIEHPGTPPA